MTAINYPNNEEFKDNNFKSSNLTLHPCYLLEKKSPLIKLASFINVNNNFDGIKATIKALTLRNPNLANMVNDYILKYKSTAKPQVSADTVEVAEYNRLTAEIHAFVLKRNQESFKAGANTVRDSAIVHKYLDGLNGIEIGASTLNPFNLDKTGGYANVDYKSNHGDLWQPGSGLEQAKVNIVSSGDDLPFKDSCLDYVISSHALEHFFDPIKTVEEWLRVIKDGGYVVMIIPHKERTFDRLRNVTPVHELIDRYNQVLVEADYSYMDLTLDDVNENNPLPRNYLILRKDRVIPEGYKSLKTDVDTSFCHLAVWDTETFLELCEAMKWNVIKYLNYDDKVGNGFMVILQK